MIQWLYILAAVVLIAFFTASFENEDQRTLVWTIGIPLIVLICLLVGALGCPSIRSVCNDSYPQYEPIN